MFNPTAAAIVAALIFIPSMFCIDYSKHSTASEVSHFVQRGSTSQRARNPLNEVPSPGHGNLEPICWSVFLALYIPTNHIDGDGNRPQGQKLLLDTLFPISLLFGLALYQQDALTCHDTNTPQPNQKDRLKTSFAFWGSSHHTDIHKQFWFRGKYP